MKKLLLILFSVIVSVGIICANTTTFHLTNKGGKVFRHDFCDMWGGLIQVFPESKNDIGFTRLFLRYHTNSDEEKERAQATLKSLVNDLTNAGFDNYLFKDGNEYIYPFKVKGADYTDVCIDFKNMDTSDIQDIQLVETQD